MTSPVQVDPAAAPPAVPPPSRSARWAVLRPLLLRLHFYAGILVAPFLLAAAVTGTLYAASYQIEEAVYRQELTTVAGDVRLPVSQQIAAARAAHPEGAISGVLLPELPEQTTQVLLDVAGLPEETRLAVFVDPYTAQVRGALPSFGKSGALPVRTWISELHCCLHLGEPGRIYSELAASWLWAVALGGLLLWLTRRRRAGRRARGLLLPERRASGLRRTVSWHGSAGLWLVLGLLFLSATGLTWSKYAGENVTALRASLNWSTPFLSTSAGEHAEHLGGGHAQTAPSDVGVDRVLRTAAETGLSGPLEVAWPAEPGGVYVVKEVDRQWPQRFDEVAVAPATGEVVETLRAADYPLMAKLARYGIAAHMGQLFGLANQVVLVLIAGGLVFMIVYGYRMWWQRRPTRGFGPPYPRGGSRRVRWSVLAALAVGAAAVGVFLPLFGISLAAFLLLDALLGRRRHR